MDDPEKIFAPGGALEAVIKARRIGKVRYIGFTGHKSPQIHLHMLDIAFQNNFMFDTVQMPLNVIDAHYDSFAKQVLPVLVATQHRRARDETHGRSGDPPQWGRERHPNACARHEPANQPCNYWMRLDGHSAASDQYSAQFPSDD